MKEARDARWSGSHVKKVGWALLLLVGVGEPGRAAIAATADLGQLSARLKPSVAHLAVEGASGQSVGTATGFLIAPDGWLVTNQHVIDGAHRVMATLADGTRVEARGVLAQDEGRDLAILELVGGPFPHLPLADSSTVAEGTPVLVLGSPLGLSWTLSEGIVSAVRQDGLPEALRSTAKERGSLLQITAPISPGSSGSPVLTFDGDVIGVAKSGVMGGGNLNFAVPAEAVRQLAATISVNAEPEPFHRMPWRNLLISLGVFAGVGLAFVISRVRGQRRGDRLAH